MIFININFKDNFENEDWNKLFELNFNAKSERKYVYNVANDFWTLDLN
jgi:hypothetical protein